MTVLSTTCAKEFLRHCLCLRSIIIRYGDGYETRQKKLSHGEATSLFGVNVRYKYRDFYSA